MDAVSENAAFKKWRSTMELGNNNLLPNFLITAASTQGGRRYMEDRLQIEVGRTADGRLDFVYTAVYDGHGGTQASEYVHQHLFNNIVDNPSFSSNDDHLVLEAIREGFLKTHSEMRQEAMKWPPTVSGFPCTAGTTATCAFIRNGKLYTGHVGDSSIVLANFAETDAGYKDAKLTDDHKPDIKTERQRIERAGGAVAIKSGIFRVIWKRPMRGHRGPVRRSTATENIPFLAVARSLGDFWSLNPISNEYVVSPEPDVDVFELKDTDNFVVVATDGLTTVVGIRAIIEVLRETEQRPKHLNNNNKSDEPSADENNCNHLVDIDQFDADLPLNHANCLLQYAFKRWSTLRADNISIICIKLNANETPTERSLSVDDRSFNVREAMAEQPMAMLRVTDTCTQLLHTNPIRLQYFGTTDKCVKVSTQSRFAEPTADNSSEALTKCHNGNGIAGSENGIVSNEEDGSDVHEDCTDANENGIDEKEHGIDGSATNLTRRQSQDTITTTTPPAKQPPSPLSARQSLKRRLHDDDDDDEENNADQRLPIYKRQKDDAEQRRPIYKRHLPQPTQHVTARRFRFNDYSSSPTSSATSSVRVSLDGDECDVGTTATVSTTKPPPAKRSRIQSVFNFITSLFGFRWPGQTQGMMIDADN